MANIFNSNASVSDLLGFIKGDVLDTYNNQCTVLKSLIDSEANNYADALQCRFCLNDNQYYLSKDANSSVYNIYSCDLSQTLVSRIDEEDPDNTFGLWSGIDELEQNISDCADSSYLMYQLSNIADNDYDDDGNMLSRISAVCGSWSGSSTYANEAYNNVLDTVSVGGDNKPALIQWLVNQYTAIINAQGDDTTGSITFTDDNYHVQGFTGSYAVGVLFQAVTTVVSAVVTIIAPIVGIVVGTVGFLIRGLIGLIPDKTDTYVVEKKASNNIYAQPIFQGETDYSSARYALPSSLREKYDNGGTGAVTVRTPGLATVINCYYDGLGNQKLQWEMFLSFDWMTVVNPYFSYTHASDTSGRWNDSSPYTDWIINFLQENNYQFDSTMRQGDCYDVLEQLGKNCTSPASFSTFRQSVEDSLQNNEDIPSESDMYKVFDRTARNCAFATLLCLSGIMVVQAYGSTQPLDWDDFSGLASWNNITSKNLHQYLLFLLGTSSGQVTNLTWSTLCNKIIPRIRKAWKDNPRPLEALTVLINNLSSDVKYIYDDIINIRKPHFEPPKYSESARATTIAIVSVSAAVAVAALVGKQALKLSQRKKQLARYQKIQALGDQLKADPDNKDLQKQFRKSIKKYNRWAGFTGTSRLSKLSGWETGDSSTSYSGPSNLTGMYNEAKSTFSQSNQEYASTSDFDLDNILRAITG